MAGSQVEVAGRVVLAPAAAGAARALYRRAVWRRSTRFCARCAPLATRRPPTFETLAQASSPGPPHSTRRARGGRYSTFAGVPCVAVTDAAKPKVCRPAHAPHSHWSKSHSHAPLHAQVGNARRRPSSRSSRSRPPTAGSAAGVLRHGLCRWARGRAAARGRMRRSRRGLDLACSTRCFGGCQRPEIPAAQGSGAAFWRRISGLRWPDEAHARWCSRWRPGWAACGSFRTLVSLG